jgi:hypothetical protein
MVNEILTASGIEYAQGRFLRLPEKTCAVYFDDIEVTAADRVTPPTLAGLPRIYTHNVTVEVYEPAPDDPSETALEAELDARGLEWAKQDRYWLKDLQRYQVVYDFSYTNKSK